MSLRAYMRSQSASQSVHHFERSLDEALRKVRQVLDANKCPKFASQVHHQYHDKYVLAEHVVKVAIASQLNCLALIGLTPDVTAELKSWIDQKEMVTLSFYAEERCTYVRKANKDVESPSTSVQDGTVMGRAFGVTSKVVTTVTEYFWNFEVFYKLEVFRGVGTGQGARKTLLERKGQEELKTATAKKPHPDVRHAASFDVDVSWLLLHLSAEFSINRNTSKCHTPRRNPDVDAVVLHFRNFQTWFKKVGFYIGQLLQRRAQCLDVSRSDTLVPVVPLFVTASDDEASSQNASCTPNTEGLVATVRDDEGSFSLGLAPLCANDANSLLAEELRHLREQRDMLARGGDAVDSITFTDTDGDVIELRWEGNYVNEYVNGTVQITDLQDFSIDRSQRTYEDSGGHGTFQDGEDLEDLVRRRNLLFSLRTRLPSDNSIATTAEASLAFTLNHCKAVCGQLEICMQYIEEMLRDQLVAAIGKEIAAADFQEYMCFHSRKLFADAFMPKLFSFSVRRSEQHSPEGQVSIEYVSKGGAQHMAQPIVTMAARSTQSQPMWFPLSASVNVMFKGDRYLHAYLQHQFSGSADAKLALVSRARQFSSMIVMVGRITANHVFDPKHAVIVQNRDELTIPLELSTIPAAQEFKDAIESLSPEQQQFAKAIRSMQLQSTLFGILIVQIRPQLERVLNLASDSLTKEIKLTQDLMQLFTTYQIPSDLLSFNEIHQPNRAQTNSGPRSGRGRVDIVRGHVKAMMDMINEAKKEELEQIEKEREHQRLLQIQAEEAAMEERKLRARRAMEECDSRQKECDSRSAPRKGMALGKKKGGGGGGLFGDMASGVFSRVGGGTAGGGGGLTGSVMSLRDEKKSCKERSAAPMAQSYDLGADKVAARAVDAADGGKGSSGAVANTNASAEPASRQQSQQKAIEKGDASSQSGGGIEFDFTSVPLEMDHRLEKLDVDGTVRPVIINVGETWQKTAQKALLASPESCLISSKDQAKEKNAAFDLLDALTKSGALQLECSSLHVLVAASHCFDKSLIETVVQDSLNPIEKVEQTTLIMASTVHQKPPAALLRNTQFTRICDTSPMVLEESEPH